jgi:hypothetical protein
VRVNHLSCLWPSKTMETTTVNNRKYWFLLQEKQLLPPPSLCTEPHTTLIIRPLDVIKDNGEVESSQLSLGQQNHGNKHSN